MGLLDPATSDGRVIFFLPWQGNTIAGTTDTPAAVEKDPKAAEEEIRWVLEEVRRYLSPDIKVRRGDVLSAWSGLRPLVRNPNAARTEGLVRNHMIHVSESGLLTIAGGKWTTYRAMAEETVDEAVGEIAQERQDAGWGLRLGCRLVVGAHVGLLPAGVFSRRVGRGPWCLGGPRVISGGPGDSSGSAAGQSITTPRSGAGRTG